MMRRTDEKYQYCNRQISLTLLPDEIFSPDLLVLLGKADLLVHVQVEHVLGEQVHLEARTVLMFQGICAAKCENHAIAMRPSIMVV